MIAGTFLISGALYLIAPDTNPALLIAAGLVIWLVMLIGIVGGLSAIVKSTIRGRRAKERTRLAAARGWRYEAQDADLPATLVRPTKSLAVPARAQAYAVVHGAAGGVAFTAFDFFLQFAPLVVTTAWIVELPHSLPRLTSAELRPNALSAHEASAAPHPQYARDALTDELAAFTRDGFLSWWVDGRLLAATMHSRSGAPPDLFVHGIEAITWLGRFFGSPAMARHAVHTTDG